MEGLHTKWVKSFCKSKNATEKQKQKVIEICENLPGWYKKQYHLTVYKKQREIESILTFTLIKGIK